MLNPRLTPSLVRRFWLFFSLWFLLALSSVELAPELLARTEKQFGLEAKNRLLHWQDVLASVDTDAIARLNRVNRFFNAVQFIDDIDHWKKTDYWATPVEFLATNGGDCEDFSIAKYLTLIALGVPEQQLRITYVKALNLNQAHMVLTYFSTPDAEPLVLDNLIDDIRPASERTDLLPVYSFNGSDLWLAKERSQGQLVGKSDRLSMWNDVMMRLAKDFKRAPFLKNKQE